MGLVDYVAFDLKTAPARYGELHSAPVDLDALQRSIALLLAGRVEYEFRTTCVPGYVDAAAVERMGEAVQGARHWAFQQFMPEHSLAEKLKESAPYTAETIRDFAEIGRRYVRTVTVRGV